jgi:hypothetical protein
MAHYVFRIIPLNILSSQFPYACRYGFEDPALEKSIAHHGVMHHPLIAPGTPGEVISGHKRIFAAKRANIKEIEVMELQSALTKEESFMLAILSNWNQNMPELDRAWTIAKASRIFNFSKEMILEEIFPALGISEDKGFYDEALEIMSLHKSILDGIATGLVPFRGAKSLSRFSKPDQEAFAAQVISQASLTTNQLMKVCEWLFDLLKMANQNLEGYVAAQPALKGILQGKSDRKAKGEQVFACLRSLRFPSLEGKTREFTALSNQLQENKSGISVDVPLCFETEGFTVRAKIKDAKDLERLSEVLEKKRKVLNSLLDIVL